MFQNRTVCLAVVCFVTAGIISVITIGVLVYFQRNVEVPEPEEEQKFFGQIRILSVAGEKLEWAPQLVNNESEATQKIKSTLQTYFVHSLAPASTMLRSVSVNRFYEDRFDNMLRSNNRGIFVGFDVGAVLPDERPAFEMVEEIRYEIVQALHLATNMRVDLDSLEFRETPIVQARSFETFEAYLASDRVNIDLALTELPGLSRPEEVSGDVMCQPIEPPEHGIVTPPSCTSVPSDLNQVCRFSCEENYVVVGSHSVSCLSMGNWSDIVPLCKAECLPLQDRSDIITTPRSCVEKISLEDARCHYSCPSKDVLIGDSFRICLNDGTWYGTRSICAAKCMVLGPIKNGRIHPERCATDHFMPHRMNCYFACDEGYELYGSATLHCDADGTWSFPIPTCRRGCDTLLSPKNGKVFPEYCEKYSSLRYQPPLVLEGTYCINSCDDGFVLEGPEIRGCGAGGIWEGTDPYCAQICPPLVLPHLMLATPGLCTDKQQSSKVSEGLVCHVSCPNNYRISNNITDVTCETNGVWSQIPERCLRTCPTLNRVTNGLLLPALCSGPEKPVEGATCSVQCMENFHKRGIGSATCLKNGRWSNGIAECVKRCPVLTKILHGSINPANCTISSFYQEEMCHYTCDPGYGLVGVAERVCLTDGTWSSRQPYCRVETQFLIRQTSADHDVCITINLVTNYIEKTRISRCLLSNRFQNWVILPSGLIKNVEQRQCIAAEEAKANAFLKLEECDSNDPLQLWSWQDDNGLRMILMDTNLEISYGYASMGKVMLVPIGRRQQIPWYAVSFRGNYSLYDIFNNVTCQRLRKPLFTSVIPDKCTENQTLENNTVCQFFCPSDRRLFGNDTRVCENGKWTNDYPTCERTCEPLTAPALGGGNVTHGCAVGRQDQGTICQFSCNDTRFMLEGDLVSFCLENGEWSSPRPNCTVYCSALPSIPRGVLFPSECSSRKMRVDSVCRLACDFPYVPVGLAERTCLPGGNWSSTSFSCQRGCPFPVVPRGPNGTVSCNGSLTVATGDVCTYTCGYIQHRALAFINSTSGNVYLAAEPGPAGNITRTCQADGLFSGTLPTCVAVCPPLMEANYGQLSPAECGTDYVPQGTVCRWSCMTGYGVRGARHAICEDTGLWSETAFYCEEETQFYIFNSNFNDSCLNVNTSIGLDSSPSAYEVHFSDLIDCEMDNSSVWTWISDHQIQHVQTGYCLSAEDFETQKESFLILKTCSDPDRSQRWRCSYENPSYLYLFHYDLYLHYDEVLMSPVAYRHRYTEPERLHEEWQGQDVDDSFERISSLCDFHTEACAPFRSPRYANSQDPDCDGASIVPLDTTCHVQCQEGYIFDDVFFDLVIATCNSSSNRWNYNVPEDFLPLECKMPCPPLTVEVGSVQASDLCINGKAFFNDICEFSCLGNLEMIGSDKSVCGYNGVWSDPVPTCTGICTQERPAAQNTSENVIDAMSLNCPYDDQPFSGSIVAGTRCHYECNPPFLPESVLSRECLITGAFSRPYPLCEIPISATPYAEANCGAPPVHPQSVGHLIEEAECEVGGETRRCAWYSCSIGYNITTNNFIHCRAGTYSWGTPPLCKRTCSDKYPYCVGYVAGQTCVVDCEDDLVISQGSSRVVCREDGFWNEPVPDCVDKLQFRIAVPGEPLGNQTDSLYCMVHSGQLTVDRYVELVPCSMIAQGDRTALWSWEGPYLLRHTQSSYCLASYKLTHGTRLTLAKCNLLDQLQQWKCSADAKRPFVIASRYKGEYVWASNDFITGDDPTEPRLVHYSSLPVSDPNDVISAAEFPDQYSWIAITNSSSNSSLVQNTLCASTATHLNDYLCPPLGSAVPVGGRMTPTSCAKMWSPLDQDCAFDCISGYALRNTSATNTTCTSNGIWTTLRFLCELACIPLSIPEFGSMSCSGQNDSSPMKGDVCTFTCDATYELFGPTTKMCQYDGRWSGEEPFCAKRCTLMPMPQNAEVTPFHCSRSTMDVVPDTICLYTCYEEFRISVSSTPGTSLVQSAVRTCFRNGTWSGNPLTCNRVCPPQRNPEHGQLSPITCTTDNSIAGFTCTLQCDYGYAVYGNDSRICGPDGAWINSVTADLGPPCRSSCPALPPVPKVNFTCSLDYTVVDGRENYVIDTTCTALCTAGFGFAPGSARARTCIEDRQWSGSDPICVQEEQFAIFLYRSTIGSRNVRHICLVSDRHGAVRKIERSRCLDENESSPYHRWSWYQTWKLKNAGTGLCLAARNLTLSARVVTAPCNDPNYHMEWSCTSFRPDGTSFFFRLLETNFHIDIGLAHTESLFLHNTSLLRSDVDHVYWYSAPYDPRGLTPLEMADERTICANRQTYGMCPPLTAPRFGNVHPARCSESEKNITAYMKCSFECNVGYRLVGGEHLSECMPFTGLWTAFTPLCAKICPNLEPLENGVVDPSSCVEPDIRVDVENEDITEDRYLAGVLRRDSCSFQCDDGWRLVGPHILTCLESGFWNAEQPTCKKKCSRLVWPDHAVAIDPTCLTSVKVQGDTCGFRCEEGYGVPKAESFCGAGSVVLADTDSGQQFCERFDRYSQMTREKGRDYDEEVFLTCTSEGQWVGEEPVCFPLCEPLSYPEHGYVEPETCSQHYQAVGSVCTYACEERYVIRGDLVSFTCVDGKWIPTHKTREHGFVITPYKENYRQPIPACDKYCLPLTVLMGKHGTLVPPECTLPVVEVGMSCELHCESGYTVQGNKIVKCKGDGTWSDVLGSCVKKCEHIQMPENGVVMPFKCTTVFNPDGTVCTFHCFDNYALDGEQAIECLSSGLWTSPPPVCRRRCLPLPRFYNGRASPEDHCYSSHIIRGNTCTFTCDPGFHLIGSSTLTCLKDGSWNNPHPTCHRICPVPFVRNGQVTCNIRGEEIGPHAVVNRIPTWGSTCHAECDTKHLPTHSSMFICRNNGSWLPAVPRCLPSGVPMYIMQKGGGTTVCLAESERTRTVVQIPKEDCLDPLIPDYRSLSTWRWMGDHNLQNGRSGRCFSLRHAGEGEILRTELCDVHNPLQHWDCSAANAFQLVLRGTDLAPTTFYRELKDIVMQHWNDWHSYYSTFDLVTLTHSSLCSRRPGGKCPPLPDIPHAIIEPREECQAKKVDSGLLCQYKCDPNNIILRGKPFTICMQNGIWSNPPPMCGEYCPPLVRLPRSAYLKDSDCVFKSSPIGRVCTAYCKEGFEAVGNVSITCASLQTWSPFAFQCLPVCPTIFNLLHGTVSPSPCTSDICTFRCEPGYILSTGTSVAQLTCHEGGSWNDDMPKCIRESQFRIIARTDPYAEEHCITMFHNPNRTHALQKQKCTSEDIQDAAQLFKWKSDQDQLMHAASGLCWTGSSQRYGRITLEECRDNDPMQLWDCGVIPGVEEYSLHIKNRSLYVDFGAGFDYFNVLSPSSPLHEVVIETDYYLSSHWYGLHHYAKGTICSFKEYNQCPRFPDIEGGVVTPAGCQDVAFITKGMICNVRCLGRYSLEEAEKSVCQQDGTWGLPIPQCIGMYMCNGFVISNRFLDVQPRICTRGKVMQGTRCYFTCSAMYHIIGDDLLMCMEQGQWSSSLPKCRPRCIGLRVVRNVEITPEICYTWNNFRHAVCNVGCRSGRYELKGSRRRECGSQGSWSGKDAICLSYCPAVTPPSSGNVIPDHCTTDTNYEGSNCIFDCNEDYVLIGKEEIRCKNGVWDFPVPRCASKTFCENIDGRNTGVKEVYYQHMVEGIYIGNGTMLTVLCKEGYTLIGPIKRRCMNNGMWEFGTPVCMTSCRPVLPPNYGMVDPPLCAFNFIPAGSTCTINCESGSTLQGERQLYCEDDGEWSTLPPTCTGGTAPDIVHRPFMVAQHDRKTGTTYCLRLDRQSRHIQVSTDCQHAAIPLQFQFRWWSIYGQIESLALPNHCWSLTHVNETVPFENFYYAKLVVEPCNQQIAFQHFQCDDVTLRQFALRIGTSNLWIGRLRDDVASYPDVNLVRNIHRHELNWEAFFVEELLETGRMQFDQGSVLERTTCNLVCGERFTANEGVLWSPGYPTQYPPNTVCVWSITTNHTIRLWVTDMDLEFGMNGKDKHCKEDILTVLEGMNSDLDDSNIIAEVCGASLTPIGPFTTFVGRMIVRFKSAHFPTQRRGFRAHWDSQRYPTPSPECHNVNRTASLVQRGRIVGGKKEDLQFVPWQAAVFEGNLSHWLCGAVLVGSRYALTAAHCVYHIKSYEDLQRVNIAYGSVNLWRLERAVIKLRQRDLYTTHIKHSDGATAHRLRDLFIHPDFYEYGLLSDIAIIVIATPVTWSNNTYPACLPPPITIPSALGKRGNLYLPKSYCTIAGWNSESENGEKNGDLSSIELPILSDRHCGFASNQVFGKKVETESIFCAGHLDGRRQSPCDGDEGGGFVCTWNDNYYVVGITSHLLGDCGSLNAPLYFTRVASFRDWIDHVINLAEIRRPSNLTHDDPVFIYPGWP